MGTLVIPNTFGTLQRMLNAEINRRPQRPIDLKRVWVKQGTAGKEESAYDIEIGSIEESEIKKNLCPDCKHTACPCAGVSRGSFVPYIRRCDNHIE